MSGAQRNPSLSPPNPVPNPYQKSAKKPEPPPPPPQRTRRRHRPTRVGWAEQREAHHPRAFPGTQNTPPSRTPPRQTESPGRSNPPLTRQPIDGHLQAGTEAIGIHITQPALTAAGPCGTAAAASCTHYFIRDHLGSVAAIEPKSQVKNHAREETRFHNAEQKTNAIEVPRAMNEHCGRRNNRPHHHDWAQPPPGADLLHRHVARHLEKQVTPEEDARTIAKHRVAHA